MTSAIERAFPWLAIDMVADHSARQALARTQNVDLAHHDRAISAEIVHMLQKEYRTNAAFGAYLRASPASLARDTIQVWAHHAAPAAFETVTGLNALASNVLVWIDA